MNQNCNYPKALLAIFIPQDVFMFFLFWDFYKKSYLNKKVKNSNTAIKVNGDITLSTKETYITSNISAAPEEKKRD